MLFSYRETKNPDLLYANKTRTIYMLDMNTLNEQELSIIGQIEEAANIKDKTNVIQVDNKYDNMIVLRLEYSKGSVINATVALNQNKYTIEHISVTNNNFVVYV